MKNFYVPFFCIILLAGLVGFMVLFASPSEIYAAPQLQLEVSYPPLPSGSAVTQYSDLTQYLKYIFDFGLFAGFFIVLVSFAWAGVLWFLSPALPNAMADAKDRVYGGISGLLILLLLYLIVTTINPYLAIFHLNGLPPVPPITLDTSSPGVAFYKTTNCNGSSMPYTNSISDLGDLSNNARSISISPSSQNSYIAVLYDITDYWGSCQYLSNTGCIQNLKPFASSSSIYPFDFSPNGDGVYLYRKSSSKIIGKEENKDGGYLKIKNSQIQNKGSGYLYVGELSQMRFTGTSTNYNSLNDCTVPKGEQDCAKYDEKGACTEKKCPNLSGESISSIYISGNYLVLLVYFAPGDSASGPWTYCQAYASSGDLNKDGPQQIKWDAIKNRGQDPNYIIVIPVKEK
jgi:hypothetical protein